MRIGSWARLLLAATPLLAGCGDFWQAPSGGSDSFTLSNSGNVLVNPSSSLTGTSTITVTAGSSFTGTVTLSCAVTTSPSGATSPVTCGMSPTSVSTSGTSTLTATTTATTTSGIYDITVTGTSGSTTQPTTVCVDVTTSGTNSCTSSDSPSGNFYILNASSLAGYSISSGKLNAISSGSQTVSAATGMAISGSIIYVASNTNGDVIPYTISSSGALTQGSAIQAPSVGAIEVDPSGKWLLIASTAGTLTALPITSAGGVDSTRTASSQNLAVGNGAIHQMTISPNGALIAVALGSVGTQVFPFNASASSPLSQGSNPLAPKNSSGGSAVSVAVDPQNRLLYIGEVAVFPSAANNLTGGLRVFTINGSTATEFTYAAPYSSGGIAPNFILPGASGNFVYVANGDGASTAGNLTWFGVSTSALTAGSSVATGDQPFGLAVDSTGGYVIAVNNQGNAPVNAYTFDTNTSGQLDTSSLTGSAGANPLAIVAGP